MNALLIIAHGSRRASSNDEIRELTGNIRAAAARFDLVAHAFLEMATPGIDAAVDELVAGGARDITALPYFLAAGNHIIEDLPAAFARIKTRHPTVRFTLAKHLGAAANMPRLILEHLDDL